MEFIRFPAAQEEHLVEAAAETDDALMEKFFSGEELTVEEIKHAIRRATIKNDICPVICGSSYKNKGVQPMLDAIVAYLPSPLDIPPVAGLLPLTSGWAPVAGPGQAANAVQG